VNKEPKLVVVLQDHEEMACSLDTWPESIFLAVCLLPSGDHHFIVFHADELDQFHSRLGRQLQLSHLSIQIIPSATSLTFGSMLFAQTQFIWRLIADTPGLFDEATDYAANYQFALEEGLDPLEFMGAPNVSRDNGEEPLDSLRSEMAVNKAVEKEKAIAPGKKAQRDRSSPSRTENEPSEAATALPAFLAIDSLTPGQGFVRPSHLGRLKLVSDRYELSTQEDGLMLLKKPGFAGRSIHVKQKMQVFLRDDMSGFAIQLLNTPTEVSQLPARILIDATILPLNIRSHFSAGSIFAKLCKKGSFLYVDFEQFTQKGTFRPEFVPSTADERTLYENVSAINLASSVTCGAGHPKIMDSVAHSGAR
jgi:hypothetical protein